MADIIYPDEVKRGLVLRFRGSEACVNSAVLKVALARRPRAGAADIWHPQRPRDRNTNDIPTPHITCTMIR